MRSMSEVAVVEAPPVVFIGELAAAAGLSTWALRRLANAGRLGVPLGRIGQNRFLKREDLPAALERIRELRGTRGVPAV